MIRVNVSGPHSRCTTHDNRAECCTRAFAHEQPFPLFLRLQGDCPDVDCPQLSQS
jgi:hypothetical protein